MKITMYLDKESSTSPGDSTAYLYNALKDIYDVDLVFESDAKHAKDADVVFCRFNIPIREKFLRELSQYNDKLFINNPLSKIKYESKEYLSLFPDLTPKTIISDSLDDIVSFSKDKDKIILKPLLLNGGRGIELLDVSHGIEAENKDFLKEYLGTYGRIAIQEYIKDVDKLGDKRVSVFGYEAISASLRFPKKGSFICNVTSGGSYTSAEITENENRIIQRIAPFLKKEGIYWAGVDIIGPYLSEINVASPGMLIEADLANKNTAGLDGVIRKLKEYQQINNL